MIADPLWVDKPEVSNLSLRSGVLRFCLESSASEQIKPDGLISVLSELKTRCGERRSRFADMG